MFRYFGLFCASTAGPVLQEFSALKRSVRLLADGFEVVEDATSLVLFKRARRGTARILTLPDHQGWILGKLYQRQGTSPEKALPSSTCRRMIASRGQHLVDQYWGIYAAFLRDPAGSTVHIIRDPTGNTACYHASRNEIHAVFSNLEDAVRFFPIELTINESYLASWMLFCGLGQHETGFNEVRNLPCGSRLTLSPSGVAQERVWKYEDFASRVTETRLPHAARDLRQTVLDTVAALSTDYDHVGIRLSGGLDSSIVAGCIACTVQSKRLTGVNYCIIDAGETEAESQDVTALEDRRRALRATGDERYYAGLVSRKWNIPVLQRRRNSRIDLSQLPAAPFMVEPALYYTATELEEFEPELAQTQGMQVIFTGQAGDSVFHLSNEPFAAIDYAYLRGLPGLWPHVRSSATLSRLCVWSVLKAVMRHGVLRQPKPAPAILQGRPTLLSPESESRVNLGDFEKIWASLGATLPPGKQDHASGAASADFYKYVFHAADALEHVDPLNAQPVWEAMLGYPTYLTLAQGMGRGLAREAFADLLPLEIKKRQVKGGGSHFYQQLIEHNASFLQAYLVEGRLAQRGYLNEEKTRTYFTSERPDLLLSPGELLNYFSAETWIRQYEAWVCQRARRNSSGPHAQALAR